LQGIDAGVIRELHLLTFNGDLRYKMLLI